MRSSESHQTQPMKQHQHHQHHRATSGGDAATSRSSVRRSGKHQSSRRHRQVGEGDCGEGDCSRERAPPSLIDQLLIGSVSVKPTTAAGSQHRHGSHRQQHHADATDDPSAPWLSSASRAASSHCPDDVNGSGSGSSTESAVGKALAKQWGVSKQYVIASLINCLSHRMRDLQRTEDMPQAAEKLAALGQLRRLIDAIRQLDLVKTLYSDRKRAKQVEAAVGLAYRAVPADLLRKWSSRENEYYLYWMALLEKSVSSLARCQDAATLRGQLDFALALVDIRGFPA